LKPERWGSPLVQEKYQAEKACDKRHPYRIIVITHFNVWKKIWVEIVNKHWYKHVPKLVQTSHEGKVTALWNKPVQKDTTIHNDKPDSISRDNEK